MKIAVLGGFGLMAEAALHDLAANPAVSQIYAADLSLSRSEGVLAKIPHRKKIKPVELDLRKEDSIKLLKGSNCVLNCSWYEYNLKAMDLALALRAHYVDLGGLYHMTLKQLKLGDRFQRAGRLALLGCGSTPGITNMMAARLAEDFESVESVGIYDASHDPSLNDKHFLPPFSLRTMLAEYEQDAPVLENGRMADIPARGRPETLEFKKPIGRVELVSAIHSETATLPGYLKNKGVKNLFFKIAYPDSVNRQLSALSAMDRSQALNQNVSVPCADIKPNDFEVLRVIMTGTKHGQALSKTLDCEIRPTPLLSAGSAAVGFAAAIGASLLARGQAKIAAGVGAPESLLDGERFFNELKARKIFSLTGTSSGSVLSSARRAS